LDVPFVKGEGFTPILELPVLLVKAKAILPIEVIRKDVLFVMELDIR